VILCAVIRHRMTMRDIVSCRLLCTLRVACRWPNPPDHEPPGHNPFVVAVMGRLGPRPGFARNINDIYERYISTIYITDSIMIFSSENITIFLLFLIFLKYQPLLLLFSNFYNLCISHTNCSAQVPKLLDGAKILPKILTLWVVRNNVTDDRYWRTANVTYSSPKN